MDIKILQTSIQAAVQTCFKKFADFSGRAARPEFWYFVLFQFGISLILSLLTSVASIFGMVSMLFSLACLLPGIAVSIRRLHDIGKSGWWVLVALIPLLGTLLLLYWAAQPGEDEVNAYGVKPLGAIPAV